MDKHKAEALARNLMRDHYLHDWIFQWGRGKNQAGVCYHSQKIIRISTHHVELNIEAEVRDTILHEIAHALAGHKAGHKEAWKRIARHIGADPTRTHNAEVPQDHRYIARCSSDGGHEVARYHRRPGKNMLTTGYCKRHGKNARLTWHDMWAGGSPITPPSAAPVRQLVDINSLRLVSGPDVTEFFAAAKKRGRVRTSAPEKGYTDIESLFAGD